MSLSTVTKGRFDKDQVLLETKISFFILYIATTDMIKIP